MVIRINFNHEIKILTCCSMVEFGILFLYYVNSFSTSQREFPSSICLITEYIFITRLNFALQFVVQVVMYHLLLMVFYGLTTELKSKCYQSLFHGIISSFFIDRIGPFNVSNLLSWCIE